MKKQACFLLIGLLWVLIPCTNVNSETMLASDNKKVNAILENKKLIEISAEGQQAAGIQTEILQLKSLPVYVNAPGEVVVNQDLTSIVTPRISAQVIQRLVRTGDIVKQGQPLVYLTSVTMAQSQANLLLTQKEWDRLKELGEQAVSAKRYQTAEVTYQQAYSALLAYGMTAEQIKAFLASNNPNKANGEFALLAPHNGTIFSADFTEGQMINAGNVLYKIVDESALWIDAKLSNGDSAKIKINAPAIIQSPHAKLSAKVLQIHHQLDAVTRTRVARLMVENPGDQLHPGEFVTCLIQIDQTPPVLAVHQTALMRTADGDQVIYVELKPNYFHAQEVKVIKKIGEWQVIEGINPGIRIVTKGAFFVHSESLKKGFAAGDH